VGTSAGCVSVVAGPGLAPEEPEDGGHDQEGRERAEEEQAERVAPGVLLGVLDALVVPLVCRRVGLLRGDDRRQPVPGGHLHAGGGREGRPGDQRPQLHELAGRNVERPQERPRPGELDVTADVDRMAPGAEDLPRCALGGGEAAERLLPLRAPDLQVHVHDVVVRDGNAREPVVDVKGAELVGGLVVPDDPERLPEVRGAEGAGGVGAAEVGAASGPVRAASLAHLHVADRLAAPERDLAVAATERAAERVGDLLVDAEAAGPCDLYRDVRLRKREGLRRGGAGEREGGEDRREDDARKRAGPAHRPREVPPGSPEASSRS
jgi:hypothetical protein